jgi:transposase
MANHTDRTPKRQALRQTGTLNPRSDRVRDELFTDSDFFDPNDLLQVKYEMLRRVRRDDFTVRQAAQLFGFSRPSFYQAQEAFSRGGLGALVPRKRGPRRAHKLSQKVMAFVEQTIAADPGVDLVAAVQQAFGLSVHRRSIERALARAKKKRRQR